MNRFGFKKFKEFESTSLNFKILIEQDGVSLSSEERCNSVPTAIKLVLSSHGRAFFNSHDQLSNKKDFVLTVGQWEEISGEQDYNNIRLYFKRAVDEFEEKDDYFHYSNKVNKYLIREAEEFLTSLGHLNGWKRAKADYMNLKKNTEEARSEYIKYANSGLLEELFPIYDKMKDAIKYIPVGEKEDEDNKWFIGVEHIKNQLGKFLRDNGVEEIIPHEGDKFDYQIHEAVSGVPNENNKPKVERGDMIKNVIEHGYKLNGRMLKPAIVEVVEN